jgi:hypothetical protein
MTFIKPRPILQDAEDYLNTLLYGNLSANSVFSSTYGAIEMAALVPSMSSVLLKEWIVTATATDGYSVLTPNANLSNWQQNAYVRGRLSSQFPNLKITPDSSTSIVNTNCSSTLNWDIVTDNLMLELYLNGDITQGGYTGNANPSYAFDYDPSTRQGDTGSTYTGARSGNNCWSFTFPEIVSFQDIGMLFDMDVFDNSSSTAGSTVYWQYYDNDTLSWVTMWSGYEQSSSTADIKKRHISYSTPFETDQLRMYTSGSGDYTKVWIYHIYAH